MPTPPSRQGYDFSDLSYAVIRACQDVQRQMGLHRIEVDYQRALEIAPSKRGLSWQREVELPIAYDGGIVARRCVDFLVTDNADQLILETKAASELKPEDIEQCLLYLHQGDYRLCLLVSYSQKPLAVRRFVYNPQEKRR